MEIRKGDLAIHAGAEGAPQVHIEQPKGVGMGAQALAHEIATAVAADEVGDGCDIAAGIFGPKMSTDRKSVV